MNSEDTASDGAEPKTTFADLGLSPKLLTALEGAGYTSPTPIQAKAIPPALEGRDVLGIAQTGTGKTAAFALPMIERLSKGRARARMPRSLVLAPTRELAAQVADAFEVYTKNQKLTMALLIGGVSMAAQERVLNAGADVIIATPGRLLDLFERGKVMPAGVEVMVVDEADRMLDMGFIPDVERIFKLTPFTRQTLFFSATMPKEIQHLVDQFLQAPVRVEASRPAQTAETIDQRLVKIREKEPKAKRAALRKAIDAGSVKNAIVFCNRKRDVDVVARSLQRHEYSAAPIHGDLPQSERMATLKRFRDGELRLLVASDVAARGLDIPDVSHVFNYDPPNSPDDYVHRIGRTGRAGKKGASITIAGPEDAKKLKAIEDMLGHPIPALDEAGGEAPKAKADEAKAKPEAEDETAEAAAETDTAEAAAAADEQSGGEKKSSGRRRGRRGGRGRTAKGKPEDKAQSQGESQGESQADPAPQEAEQPAEEDEAVEAAPAPKAKQGGGGNKGQSASDTRHSKGGQDKGKKGSGQNSGPKGFGDHTPAFVTRSVKERLSANV